MDEKDLYIEYFRLQDLIKMERNPKLHSAKIDDSFAEYGYVEPVLIDEGSGKLVAGHGRLERLEKQYGLEMEPPSRIKVHSDGSWMVPVIRGVTFDSPTKAEEYGITSNLLTIDGGFDTTELEQLIDEGIHPIGTEAVLEAEMSEIMEEVEKEVEVEEDYEVPEEEPVTNEREQSTEQEEKEEEKEPKKKLDDQQIYDQLPFELQGVFELSEEAYWLPEEDAFASKCIAAVNPLTNGSWNMMPGANSIGIPNLRPDMLADKLPPDLKIWGDRQSTPDDGGYYFYNYGAAPHRGLPFDRTVFSFFTHDDHIETWWATPAYRVGQLLIAGTKNIVVPDFSLWDFAPTAAHIWSLYRSAFPDRIRRGEDPRNQAKSKRRTGDTRARSPSSLRR